MKKYIYAILLILLCSVAMADSTDVRFMVMASDAGDTTLGYVDSVVFTNIYYREDSIGSGSYTTYDTGRIVCTVRVDGLYNSNLTADAYVHYDNAFGDVEYDYIDGYWAGYAVSTSGASDTVTVMISTTDIAGTALSGAVLTVTFKGRNIKDTCNDNAIGYLYKIATAGASGIASMPLIKNSCFSKDKDYQAVLTWSTGEYKESFSIDDTTTSIWWIGI